MIRIIFYLFFLMFFINTVSWADEIEDGTYDATVTTSSGTYSVPVEVSDGEVKSVDWPNGGQMTVYGADINGNTASGTNSRGDYIDIEVDR